MSISASIELSLSISTFSKVDLPAVIASCFIAGVDTNRQLVLPYVEARTGPCSFIAYIKHDVQEASGTMSVHDNTLLHRPARNVHAKLP